MIKELKDTGEIKALFKAYLNHMTQYLEIKNHDSWCENAVKHLKRYTTENDRHAYSMKLSDYAIGFALVNTHLRFNKDGFAVAEFYIQKEFERKRYGQILAYHVFEQFPGNWEIAVSLKNDSAIAFWERVVSSYTAGKFIKLKKPSFSGYGFVFNNKK